MPGSGNFPAVLQTSTETTAGYGTATESPTITHTQEEGGNLCISFARMMTEEDDDPLQALLPDKNAGSPRDEFERTLQAVYTDLETGTELTTLQEKKDVLKKLKTDAAKVNTQLPIQKAAVYIKDALIGHSFPFEDEKIKVYSFYRSKRVMAILDFTCILMAALSLLQVHSRNSAEQTDDVGWINPFIILAELWCASIFVAQSVLQYNFMSRDTFLRHPICMTLAVCNCIYIFDIVLMPVICNGDMPIFSTMFDDIDRPHLKFYVRPIFGVMHFSKVRETLPSIARTVRALIPVILFICVFLVVFAILGFMLFYDRNSYFSSVPWALYQLHVALTTANFPDVMIGGYVHPVEVEMMQSETFNESSGLFTVANSYTFDNSSYAYNDFSWGRFTRIISPLYFIFFYLIGFYFLLSVAFAVVFDEYKKQLKDSVLGMHSFRRKNLMQAYFQLTQYVDAGYDEFNRRLDLLADSINHNKSYDFSQLNPHANLRPSPRTADREAIRDNQLEYLEVPERAKRLLDLLNTFQNARAQEQCNDEKMLRKHSCSVAGGLKEARRSSTRFGHHSKTEVNLYIFTLIYNALFPEEKGELAARDSKGEIKVGSRVGLLNDLEIDGGVLKKGTTGIVITTPGYCSQYYEVTFVVDPRNPDALYTHLAIPEEMFLIEPPDSNARMARVYYHAMDTDGMRVCSFTEETGTISNKEFMAFYHALQLKVKVVSDTRLWLERVLPPTVFESRIVQEFVTFFSLDSPWPNRMLDAVVAGGLVLMVIHFQVLADDERQYGKRRYNDTWFQFMYAELAVQTLQDAITVLRIVAMGMSRFFSKKWNKFAFLVLVVDLVFYSATAIAACFYGKHALKIVFNLAAPDDDMKDPSMPDLFVIILFLRLICGIRILAEFQRTRHILKTFMNILPVFRAYIFATMVVYFYYACVGMLLLSKAEVPHTTTYATNNYYALNFESFYNSCVTLWCIMIVNNWFVIVDGYRAACGDWVIIYFVSFWIFCVLLVMNVVTAVTVELWGSQWELNRRAAVNIKNNPFAKRIVYLNQLKPEDGEDFYLMGLPMNPDGSRPYYKVGYRKYSHKAELALERMFLKDAFHQNPDQWTKKHGHGHHAKDGGAPSSPKRQRRRSSASAFDKPIAQKSSVQVHSPKSGNNTPRGFSPGSTMSPYHHTQTEGSATDSPVPKSGNTTPRDHFPSHPNFQAFDEESRSKYSSTYAM